LEDEELCQELAEHLQLTPVVSTRWALVPGGLGRLHQDMGSISQMEVLFAEKIWGNHLQMEVFNSFHGKKSKQINGGLLFAGRILSFTGRIFRQAMEMLTAGGNESLRSINGCGSKLSTPIILDG
jgi:hypothetical protein